MESVSQIWLRIFAKVFFLALFCLMAGVGFGLEWALALFSLALLVLGFGFFSNLASLDRWLDSPEVGTIPEGSGMWEEVFSRLRRMVRKYNQEQALVEDAYSHLQQATAALPDGVVILDETDRIEWCNPMAESFFGLDNKRDQGQQINYLVRQPLFVDFLTDFQGRSQNEPLMLKLSQQHERILSLQLIPYAEKKKLLVCRDITRIENVERMRRDFVANVSHELRTPLTVIGGFLETLSDLEKPDPEMTKRSLELMSGQTERMKRLVEDLLTLSRLENAENQLREEEVSMTDLLKSLHQEALSLSEGKHQIELKLETEAGLIGNCDELRSAFSNLISNAIRYTQEGGTIKIGWKIEAGKSVFSVKDSGIGIEAEHIPRLTERFYRVDRGRSRGTGGTGLGLAIVKHVLNRHQAKLEIASQFGKGSQFLAIFPPSRLRNP